MDATASLLVAGQAIDRLNLGASLTKQTAKADKEAANILAEAIENTPPPQSGRGSLLDIKV